MKKDKTIRQWFESVEDDKLRVALLENMVNETSTSDNLSDAIKWGIKWGETKQGFSYWKDIKIKAMSGQIKLITDKSKIKKSELLKRIESLEKQLEFQQYRLDNIGEVTDAFINKLVTDQTLPDTVDIKLDNEDNKPVDSSKYVGYGIDPIKPYPKTSIYNEEEESNVFTNNSGESYSSVDA
jgi:hypothetical protein